MIAPRSPVSTSGEIAPYLASLLSIPTEGRYAVPENGPPERGPRNGTIAGADPRLARRNIDARKPRCWRLFEDAHWVDPTSFRSVETGIVERGAETLRVPDRRWNVPAGNSWPPGSARAPCHRTGAQYRFGRNPCPVADDRSDLASGKSPSPPKCSIRSWRRPTACPLFVWRELTKSVLEVRPCLREEHAALCPGRHADATGHSIDLGTNSLTARLGSPVADQGDSRRRSARTIGRRILISSASRRRWRRSARPGLAGGTAPARRRPN